MGASGECEPPHRYTVLGSLANKPIKINDKGDTREANRKYVTVWGESWDMGFWEPLRDLRWLLRMGEEANFGFSG
jgi:hypothetical protein